MDENDIKFGIFPLTLSLPPTLKPFLCKLPNQERAEEGDEAVEADGDATAAVA